MLLFPSDDGFPKIIYQDANDGLLAACAGMMTRYLGNDGGVKSAASEIFPRAKLAQYAPPKGKFMLHAVAMGSEEAYGPNKNGDAFSKQALEENHHTFVDDGYMFREHLNHDPDLQIGTIKASAWHPGLNRVELVLWGDCEKAAKEYEEVKSGKPISFSMSCFPAGTRVLMADGSHQPIESLLPGQQVITHHGRTGQISHTMYRDRDELITQVQVAGRPEPLLATPDHSFWTRPQESSLHECPVCGERFSRLKCHLRQKHDAKHRAAYRDLSRYCEGWRDAGDLCAGDWVRVPVDQAVHGSVEKHRAYLLGLYLAKGHIYEYNKTSRGYSHRHRRLDLTFGRHEDALISEAMRVLQKETHLKVQRIDPPLRPTVSKVRLDGRVRTVGVRILTWFLEHGHALSGQKSLSVDALHWEAEGQREIIRGWLDGDGSFSKKHGRVSGITVSERLANQMQQLAARCGMASSVCRTPCEDKQDFYTVSFQSQDTGRLNFCRTPSDFVPPAGFTEVDISHLRHQLAGTVTQRQTAKPHVMLDVNGHLYARVQSVKTTPWTGRVYDITVPGDHGFVAEGIGVSNCKVAHDVCSCCGHQAKSAAAYCGHLRNHMGLFIPEFQKYAYAQNPNPRFFDMSAVERPADRIAHLLQSRVDGLQKAASANRVISGAELAIIEGLVLPGRFSQAVPFKQARMKLLEKLAVLEGEMEGWLKNPTSKPHLKQAFTKNVATSAFYPDQHLNLQDVEARPGTVFRELAKRACLLSPQSLWSYVQGEPHTKLASQDVLHRLPTLFRDMLKRASADGGIGNISHCCDMDSAIACELDQGYDAHIDGLMSKADELFGIGDQMGPRTLRISIVKGAADLPDVPGDEATPEIQGMMDLYGVYKLAAVEHIAELHPDLDDDMLSMLAIGQNFQLATS